jgi:hypothetical protein
MMSQGMDTSGYGDQGVYDGGGYGGGGDGGCADCQGGGRHGCGRHGHGGGDCGLCDFGDLWCEVHAHRRFWLKGETLYVRTRGNPLPALVTTSPIGTPQAQAGVLPESATTSVLFGGAGVNGSPDYGGKLSFGYWLVDGEFIGIEGHYLALQERSSQFNASSTFSDGIQNGDQILARPFFNVDTGQNDAAILAFPNFILLGSPVDLDGSINIRSSRDLQSAGVLLSNLLWIDFTANYRVDLLGGYRFFRLDDSVVINDSSLATGGLLGQTLFESTDAFGTRNEFHGGELGVKGQIFRGRWSLEALGKIALGNNHQTVNINGTTRTTTQPNTPQSVTITTPGGFLAQPTNSGRTINDEFAVLPEVGLTLRYDVTHNLRATMGYTFMYMDRTARSGGQIDTSINPTQIGGTLQGEARPAASNRQDDFMLYGFTGGVEYRY